MFKVNCKACGQPMDVPRQEGLLGCPHCANVYRIYVENDGWKMENMGPPGFSADNRRNQLVWFEMQIAPSEFRLAIVPNSPILFGDATADGHRPGKVTLIEDPGAQEAFLVGLGDIVRLFEEIFSGPEQAPEHCFSIPQLSLPSLHLRISWANGHQWASVYPRDEIPFRVFDFYTACRDLAYEVLGNTPTLPMSARHALGAVDRATQRAKTTSRVRRAEAAGSVAHIKITWDSNIILNGKKVPPRKLKNELQRVQQQNGVVKYYRERPHQPMPPQTERVASGVIDLVMALGLPLELNETDFG